MDRGGSWWVVAGCGGSWWVVVGRGMLWWVVLGCGGSWWVEAGAGLAGTRWPVRVIGMGRSQRRSVG